MFLFKKLIARMNKLIVALLTLLIKAYRFMVSPLLGTNCRFHPSCSHYAQESITKHGAIYGVYLGIRRLLKCHPWHPGGLDPVPPTSKTNNSHPQTEA